MSTAPHWPKRTDCFSGQFCVHRSSLAVADRARHCSLLWLRCRGPIESVPGTWQLQPIHVADLAHVVRLLLETDKPLPRFLDLGGAAPLTTDELTEKMRSWLLLPRRSFLSIPASVLRRARASAIFSLLVLSLQMH